MIITAFTIAKDLAQAKELGIKKLYGDLCTDCNTLVRYTSNNNCVKCSIGRNKKTKSGKSPKIKDAFYCKDCREYMPISFIGKTVKKNGITFSLCKPHASKEKDRITLRQHL